VALLKPYIMVSALYARNIIFNTIYPYKCLLNRWTIRISFDNKLSVALTEAIMMGLLEAGTCLLMLDCNVAICGEFVHSDPT